jgi:titin
LNIYLLEINFESVHRYNFCLRGFVVADKPTAPENLAVSSTTENTVSLRWSEPSDNGGCLITQYVIEKREGNKRTWQREGTTSDSEYTAIALTAGQSYGFQVAAENEVGVGPFVELPKSVIPKSQFGE